MSSTIRRYSELSSYDSFIDRFEYLRLDATVGEETFGFDRYLNQKFYRSKEWKTVRDYVIARDLGCDLGIDGFSIPNHIIIHHMNPISRDDISLSNDNLLNPEYLISVSHSTHNAIHYGDLDLLAIAPQDRILHDTCPWKKHKIGGD